MSDFDKDLLELFIEESREHLEGIENDLLAIEEQGSDIDEELVNKVFRAAHSIKGAAGVFGLTNIKDLSHDMENVLNLVRNREMVPDNNVISVLLSSADLLKSLINNSAESNDVDIKAKLQELKSLEKGSQPAEQKKTTRKKIEVYFPGTKKGFKVPQSDLIKAAKGGKYIYLLEYDLLRDVQSSGRSLVEVIQTFDNTGVVIDSKTDIKAVGKLEKLKKDFILPFYLLFATVLEEDMLTSISGSDPRMVYCLPPELYKTDNTRTPQKDQSSAAPINTDKNGSETDQAIKKFTSDSSSVFSDNYLRINVKTLDRLMVLAGELVLSRNQLLQSVHKVNLKNLESVAQRINMITSNIQESVMSTRMQPIEIVFNKFKRVIRDLAASLKKNIALKIQGGNVELDKTIIELITDPLTHIVRNSIDHGLETPDERNNTGKDSQGTVTLKAFHLAGQVVIEIQDDGRGIDPEKIKAKALEKNLYTGSELEKMSNNQIMNILLLPGFSTAERVSDISGRGVGMDVVNTNIHKLGGNLKITSDKGQGTTVRITLPLTLAIIPALFIEDQETRYAIPQANLVELVRVPPDQVKSRIEQIDEALVIRLRDKLLPLLKLSSLLGIDRTFYTDHESGDKLPNRRQNIKDRRSDENVPENLKNKRKKSDRRNIRRSSVNIAVVKAGDSEYGIIVDSLLDSEEVVVKPLGSHFKACKGYYVGATITGDGSIALILDINGIAGSLNIADTQQNVASHKAEEKNEEERRDKQSLILVKNHPKEHLAVPLGMVARIEKIKTDNIDVIAGKKTIKYRNTTIALFELEDITSVRPKEDLEEAYVIVFVYQNSEVGLLVSELVDVVSVELDIDDSTFREPGISGSAIIQDKTTLIIDLYGLVRGINDKLPQTGQAVPVAQPAAALGTILLVEDSPFFRTNISNFLEDSGYRVYCAENGRQGLKLLKEKISEIDLIVTDIEMPELNGIEMTKEIRADKRFSELPIIAVTSLAGDEDESTGYQAGIDDYQIKLDREKLLEHVRERLQDRNVKKDDN